MAPLRRAANCLTPSVLQSTLAESRQSGVGFAGFPGNRPVVVRTTSGGRAFQLDVRLRYRLHTSGGTWTVRTFAYVFRLGDAEDREILAFHWHPGGEGFAAPHLHIGHAAAERIRPELQKAHIPTGIIVVEDFILLAVREFEIPAVPDVERILAETRAETTAAAEYSTSIR